MANPLSILLDPAQDRLAVDALSVLVSGRDWDPTAWQDIWVDPVTNTCMLRPAAKYADWATTATGIYTKLGLGDFGLSSPWQAHQADLGGPFMYYAAANSAGLAAVGPSVGVNQPMVVELFTQGVTNAPYGILDVGWSDTGDSTAGVAVRFYADGSADVYQNGYLVGSYSGGGGRPSYFDQALPQGPTLGGGSTPMTPRGYQTILLIPCRDREMLVVSSMGGSFCHIFQDLPEGVAGLTITPASTFWFQVQTPVAANLRFALLQYAAGGYVCGAPSNWRTTPSGSPSFEVYQSISQTGAGLVSPSVVTPATNPYSLANPMQIELSLTAGSAPNWTPFVYGARTYYPSSTQQTVSPTGGALQLLPYVTGFHLEVSDTVGGARATVTLKQPSAIGTAGGAAITTQCHRPIQISDENGMILNGVAEPPHWSDSYGFSAADHDQNQEVELVVRDMWKLAEEYVFSDPTPLDGMTLAAAYTLVAETIGIPSSLIYVSPSAASFTLPFTAASGGDWAFLCDVGDKGAEVLDKLHQTYAATWFHGFRPNGASPPRLCLIDPADAGGLPSTAAITLYPSLAAAEAASAGWSQVYRSYRTQILEPEANDVTVTGRDPRGGKPVIAHQADTASQTVTTPPASRPANWLGSIRKYGWIDPSITTIGAATYACGLLTSRLTPARTLVEFECEYLPGVWRGDLVTLMLQAGGSVTIRIKTFSGSFENLGAFGAASSPDGVWRPCRYVAEIPISGLEAPLDVYGVSIQSIAANWHTLKALSKQQVYEGGAIVARRPVLNRQG